MAPSAVAGACGTGMAENLQEAISTVKVESIYQSKSIMLFALAQNIFKKYQVTNIYTRKFIFIIINRPPLSVQSGRQAQLQVFRSRDWRT
ncbi:MAG: hypothetical protein ABIP67_05220 [Burkholderiales bacterium]